MQTSSPDAQLSNKDRPAMSRLVALLFAVCSGLAVANIYYAQPLLDSIAQEFSLSPSSIGIVITVTQICYALGLFLLVPLGDLLNRRKLIIIQMLLSVLALVLVGTAQSSSLLFAGMAVVGLLAVITQTLVAFAAWRPVRTWSHCRVGNQRDRHWHFTCTNGCRYAERLVRMEIGISLLRQPYITRNCRLIFVLPEAATIPTSKTKLLPITRFRFATVP